MVTVELLESVRAATGPDRELDALILCHFNGWTVNEDTDPNSGSFAFWDGEPWKSTCHNCSSWDQITASVDAALALVERVLPGHSALIGYGQAEDTLPWARIGNWSAPDATAQTLPLAIITAALSALAKEPS